MSIDDVRILLTINGIEHDISALLLAGSLTINETFCNSEYKSTINSASWSIRYDEEIFLLLRDSLNIILVQILAADESSLFDGQMDPVVNEDWTIPTVPSPINLEAVDFTVALDKMISTSVSYPAMVDGTAFYIYRRGYESASILYLLLDLAGLSDRISADAPDILDTVVHFSATKGEVTYRALIDPLLAEHLHAITAIDGDGITWKRTAYETIGSVALVDENHILASGDAQKFSMSKRYDVHDGVKVEWPKTKVMLNALLWRGSLPTGDTEDPLPGELIAAGDYWPEDSDIVETWMDYESVYLDTDYLSGASRLKNDDISLIASSDHYIKDTKDAGVALDPITEDIPVFYESLRARLRYKNSGVAALKLYWSEIYGKALIQTSLIGKSYPENSSDPHKYPTSYIYNADYAQTLVEALWMRLVGGCWDIKFASRTKYTIGSVIKLKQGASQFDRHVLIIGCLRTYDFSGIRTYQAVTTDPLSSVDSYMLANIPSGSSHTPLRLLTQYASTITGEWHSLPVSTDYYMRSSSDGGFTWTAGILFRGATARSIKLEASSYTVPVSSRGTVRGGNITLIATLENIPMPEEGLTWYSPNITLLAGEDHYHKTADVDSFALVKATITVSLEYEGVIYASPIGISKSYDGMPAPLCLSTVFGVYPTTTDDGEPLVVGDFFLYLPKTEGGEWDTANVLFGHTLRWTGGAWESTDNSYCIGAVAKDACAYSRSTGLIIYSAKIYTDALVARNAQIGTGTGMAGSGLRTRIMEDDIGDGTGQPRIDVYDGAEKIFEINPLTKNIEIGEFANGNGLQWNHSEKKLYVKGAVDASSGKFTGQLDTISIYTLLGGDTEYPKPDQTTIESLLTLLIAEVEPNTSLRMTGTINGVGFKSVSYSSMTVSQSRLSHSATVLWETWYKRTSTIIINVIVTFTMNDDSTVAYVLRKILGVTNGSGTSVSYPNYPASPASIGVLLTWANYSNPDPDPTHVPSAFIESEFASVGTTRAFPYSVVGVSVWDSTQERLFLKNIPTSAPSESGRVWRSGTSLQIVP